MTLAIQRQPRFNKVLLAIGLIAVVAALAAAMNRVDEPTNAGNPAVVQTHTSPTPGHRFESVQDDYLVPQSILNRQAAMRAELRLQDGYLPPSTAIDSEWAAFLSTQDGYLPPAGWTAAPETSGDSTARRVTGPQ